MKIRIRASLGGKPDFTNFSMGNIFISAMSCLSRHKNGKHRIYKDLGCVKNKT